MARASRKKTRLSARKIRTAANSIIYKHILIPTDGSELSKKAVRYGVALACALNAKVTGITVTAPFSLFMDPYRLDETFEGYRKRTTAISEKYLGRIQEAAAAVSVNCETIHAEHEHPYQAIIDAAKKNGCDLIVMASHGRRGFSALVLGSETAKVLTHSTIPVLVHR